MKGRSILDGALYANKCIDTRIRDGIPGVICKVDMEKVYDHVGWGFLLDILWRFGFGVKWRNWVTKCMGLASFSILVNGIPTSYFGCSRGIRQGDPISPQLFLLVVEVMGAIITQAILVGMLEGFHIGSGPVVVSHLQFTDDTLILYANS